MSETAELPLVSIVIPSYNQGVYIEQAIRSVLLQNYPRIECIVIDGGSSDETEAILGKYDSVLKYWISETDQGQTHAINKGLKKADGDILGFLNCDDLYLQGAFHAVSSVLTAERELAFVYGDNVLIGKSGEVLGWGYVPEFSPVNGYNLKSEAVFWSKHAMDKVGCFDESLQFALDLDYFCRLYKTGPIHKINRPLGCFRCHEDAKSAKIPDICDKESRMKWLEHFGHENYRYRGRSSSFKHYAMLLKYPRRILFPYVKQKFRTTMGKLNLKY